MNTVYWGKFASRRSGPTFNSVFQLGFSVTIATNPIFLYALEERLAWINCHDFLTA